jgi:hypothetical protein
MNLTTGQFHRNESERRDLRHLVTERLSNAALALETLSDLLPDEFSGISPMLVVISKSVGDCADFLTRDFGLPL